MMSTTVLLADDSAPVRRILRGQLTSGGFNVVEAADGADAIRLCRQVRPDVVLLDVDMPGIDGHQAISILKADPALADTPVIFLTGRSATTDVVEGRQRRGGHAVGDDVLVAIASRLRSGLRSDHTVARWGGEEFVVLSPGTDRVAAERLGERLRTVVGWEPIAVAADRQLSVTVSIGCATGLGTDPRELLQQADAALYAAKAAGRDRVVVAPAA